MSGRGQASNQSSESEDKGLGLELGKRKRNPRRKKHIWEQRFVIHPDDLYATLSELSIVQRSTSDCTTIPICDSKSEREIRESLAEKLPKLKDRRFTFFTKIQAKNCFCPCSCGCEDTAHEVRPIAEWNGKNIKKMAKGNRVVYIHCLCKDTAMTEPNGERAVPVGQTQAEFNTPHSCTSHRNQFHLTNQSPGKDFLPGLATKCALADEENISLDETISFQDQNSPAMGACGGATLENGQTDSAYNTIQTESSTHTLSEGLSFPLQNEEMQPYIDSLGSDSSPSSPSLIFEIINQEYNGTPLEIEEIVPNKGDIAGGETFFITLAETGVIDDFQMQFHPLTDPIPLTRCGDKVFRGKVPASPNPGVVQAYLVNYVPEKISNKKSFTYIDPNNKKEEFVEQEINDPKDFEKMLMLLSMRVGKVNLNSNELETKGTNLPGGVKTQALLLLNMIVDTAAKINAIDFFRIIFCTGVGRSVFKSFNDEQTPLEEIARGNGHDELALLLEKKHLIYRDDEDGSDDEVDWKELAKAIKKYQTMNGETAEKKSMQSTSSSEHIYGYLGDSESSTSLLSLHDSANKCSSEYSSDSGVDCCSSMCRKEPKTCHITRLAEVAEYILPPPTVPFVRRDLECEEIVANLTSKHRRIGIICGAQGIGKTAVAIQVGHMLLSTGWHVHYHLCKDQDASLEMSALLPAQAISEISHPTLFILDNMDMYHKSDRQDEMRKVFQKVVESAIENRFLGILFVTCKEINFLVDIAFSFNLQPLSNTAEVELLDTASRKIPADDLNTFAEGRDNIPFTLKVAKGLNQEETSETAIINEISSSDTLRIDKAKKLDNSRPYEEESGSLATLYLNPRHFPCRGDETFAPKEVASLRPKRESFDAVRSRPLYRDTEQIIHNIYERLHPQTKLEEPTDVLKGCLKIQDGSKHPQTGEKELSSQKRKDARVLKPQNRPKYCIYRADYKSFMLPVVEQGVEPGRESENILQEGQNPTTQTSEQSVSPSEIPNVNKISIGRKYLEGAQNESKSVCLSVVKTKCFVLASLAFLLVIIGMCVPFISQALTPPPPTSSTTTNPATIPTASATIPTASATIPTASATIPTASVTTKAREVCMNGPSTLHCEAVKNVNAVLQIEWKIKFPGTGWNRVSNWMTTGNSIITRPMLPEGIKVLNISNDAVTLERIAKNNTNYHTNAMCLVYYSDNSVDYEVYEIKFTAKCAWIQEGHDLNLTKVMPNFFQSEPLHDIEWYDINGTSTTTRPTATAASTTKRRRTKIEACSNWPSTVPCKAVKDLNSALEVEWKFKFAETGWNRVSYCNSIGCIVTRPMLTEGIKLLNVSKGTVTLESIAKNDTNYHAQAMCQAYFSDHSMHYEIFEINFIAKCVWIQEGRDLSLTRIMLSMLPCKERIADIEWYNINKSRFAYCKTCQSCVKTPYTRGNYPETAFWNRLQVTRGSLMLIGIQKSDDRLTFRVIVHMKWYRNQEPPKPLVYTVCILVESPRVLLFPQGRIRGKPIMMQKSSAESNSSTMFLAYVNFGVALLHLLFQF